MPVSCLLRSLCSFWFLRLHAVLSYDSEVLNSETSIGELAFKKLCDEKKLSDETYEK